MLVRKFAAAYLLEKLVVDEGAVRLGSGEPIGYRSNDFDCHDVRPFSRSARTVRDSNKVPCTEDQYQGAG
ncbi:hypothetical protein GCM10014713_11020 [Streptomyces purpureus]|uniref:Uncharacterized protein n=1 Tax=Streptomyces purpureus TaxID=1951 RepID=A0A918LLS1_9ACTN|nr:hypothetical protein GCM10014713_11020 [Streptomyces purpureus]